jgi:hypothetical protein
MFDDKAQYSVLSSGSGAHMETKTSPGVAGDNGSNKQETVTRGRRRNRDVGARARFFLPKPGSTLKAPELGQEMTNEGDALVQALKRDQHFYTVTAWKAVAQQNGGSPVIIKQEIVTDTKTE